MQDDDDTGKWWRKVLAQRAAVVALAGLCIALLNAWYMARNKYAGTMLLNLVCLVVVPLSGGLAAANFSRTDSSAMRAFVGIASGLLSLGALVLAWFAIYLGAGGSFRM
ncbi:MAG TPA: hypothetical protein VGO61_07940 [Steroidobacteraceae bacterium]|nr:hypothetical protein [Steroidobacteraceae bacterium]